MLKTRNINSDYVVYLPSFATKRRLTHVKAAIDRIGAVDVLRVDALDKHGVVRVG